MEPITATLATAKEIYEVAKTIQKVYNVSKEMKTVAESEGKDQIMATKDLADTAINMKQEAKHQKGESLSKELKVEGDMYHSENNETLLSQTDFVDKLEPTYVEAEYGYSTVDFVEKLPLEEAPKELQNILDIYVDRLLSSENKNIGVEQIMKNDISEATNYGTNDSPRKIKTINDSLEGRRHPDTGVLYKRKVVETDTGEKVEGVFPQFKSELDVQLPEDLEKATDKKQFEECNRQLKKKCDSDPSFRSKFTTDQQADIDAGRTPDGYTWHHNEEKGKMQLVDSDTHLNTRHTGGRNIWGGGTDNRK